MQQNLLGIIPRGTWYGDVRQTWKKIQLYLSQYKSLVYKWVWQNFLSDICSKMLALVKIFDDLDEMLAQNEDD